MLSTQPNIWQSDTTNLFDQSTCFLKDVLVLKQEISSHLLDFDRIVYIYENIEIKTYKLQAWGLQLLAYPLAQVFSCEFCEISKNTFFHWMHLMAASACMLP